MESKSREAKIEAKVDPAVSRKVTIAIKELHGKTGVNLKDLKKFLKNEKRMEVKDASAQIQLVLKRKMDKGELTKLEGGLYKLTNPGTKARNIAKAAKGPAGDGKSPAAKAKKPAGETKRAVKTPAKKTQKAAKSPSKSKEVKSPKNARAQVHEVGIATAEVGSAAAPEIMQL